MQTKFTLTTFLLALVGVTAFGALVGYLIRKFFYKDMPANGDFNEGVDKATEYFVKRTKSKLQSSAIVLLALGLAVVAQPVACQFGVDLNFFGLSPTHQFWFLMGGGSIVLFGLFQWAKSR
ncbi:MAG: hypothetical protein IPJ75_05740 [Ignavibacteriales bacterium]|nr:hypothetical protein [Ignavibacteriales bacterium]